MKVYRLPGAPQKIRDFIGGVEIKQGESFTPIIVVFETPEEADTFYHHINFAWNNNSVPQIHYLLRNPDQYALSYADFQRKTTDFWEFFRRIYHPRTP